jgi:hypothetical protein
MRSLLWRVVRTTRYLHGMGRPRRQEPERRLPALDGWEGYWVAVKDGEIVAAAHSSRDLVRQLVEKGPTYRDAVAQYVPRPSEEIVIGVG